MRAWTLHLLLLGLAAFIVGRAAASHQSVDDALRVALDADAEPGDRVWGAHVAANRARGQDPRIGDALAREFLGSDQELLREAALTIDFCRHAVARAGDLDRRPPPLQNAYVHGTLAEGPWTPHRLRSLVFHTRKAGGPGFGRTRAMTRTEAHWILRTLRGAALPPWAEVQAHVEGPGTTPPPARGPR